MCVCVCVCVSVCVCKKKAMVSSVVELFATINV